MSTSLKYNPDTGKIEEEVNDVVVREVGDPITHYVDTYLDTLKSKSVLGTDANGKIIEGSGYLKLDQTTPQTIVNGIPLLTGLTPTTDYQIATKKYVDDNAGGVSFGTAGQIPFTNSATDDFDYGSIAFSGGVLDLDTNQILAKDILPSKRQTLPFMYSGIGFPVLKLLQNVTNVSNYYYRDITSVTNYTIQTGDYLTYSVFLPDTNVKGGVDFTFTDATFLRDNTVTDQNGLSSHPNTDLSAYCNGNWYHRKFDLTPKVGKTISYYDISLYGVTTGAKYIYVSNVMITDVNGNIRKVVFRGGETITSAVHLQSNSTFTSLDNSNDRYDDDFSSSGASLFGNADGYVQANYMYVEHKLKVDEGGPSDDITYGISAGRTFTDTAEVNRIANGFGMTTANTGTSNANFMAIDCKVLHTGRATSKDGVGLGLVGLRGTIQKETDYDVESATAVNGLFYMSDGGGDIVDAYGFGMRWAANMNAGGNDGYITNAYGFYAGDGETFGTGNYITNLYGFYCPALTKGTTINQAFRSDGGQLFFENNAAAKVLATFKAETAQSADIIQVLSSADAELFVVESGGVIQTSGYKSSDGSPGMTGSVDTSATPTLTIKNGLVISAA